MSIQACRESDTGAEWCEGDCEVDVATEFVSDVTIRTGETGVSLKLDSPYVELAGYDLDDSEWIAMPKRLRSCLMLDLFAQEHEVPDAGSGVTVALRAPIRIAATVVIFGNVVSIEHLSIADVAVKLSDLPASLAEHVEDLLVGAAVEQAE